MEHQGFTQSPSRSDLAVVGAAALFFVTLGSVFELKMTQVRCDTSPQDDPGWHFSNYCTAMHSLHLFNFPDTVSGGGVLEGIFALPILFTIGGLLVAVRTRRFAPLGIALSVAGLLIVLLLVLAIAFASATFPGGP